MIRPNFKKWGQSAEAMRRLSLTAAHPRSRERYQALYMIGNKQTNASQWAGTINRSKQTVRGWVHQYNTSGPLSLIYQPSGGRQPLFTDDQKKIIVTTVKEKGPADYQLPGYGWTLKKLRYWVAEQLGQTVSRTTLRTLLKQAGLSWTKSKKALSKADPKARAAFVKRFQGWFEQVHQDKLRLIYVDEAHFHQDLAVGYRWSTIGEADWVPSYCPSRKNRLNWYGAYDFSNGQCLIWQADTCDSDNTVAFLQRLADWNPDPTVRTLIIWDRAPWHSKAAIVRQQAEALDLWLVDLPSYSPDLNPIEGLWKWMREALTQHHCYRYLYQLERACFEFVDQINLDPDAIISRLWPKFALDPSYEKVLFSF